VAIASIAERSGTMPLTSWRGRSGVPVMRMIANTSAEAIAPRKKMSWPAGSDWLTNLTIVSLTMKQPIESVISSMPRRLAACAAARRA
jgi:hypothetical protein